MATVLGAGIQGCCVALMLRRHGYRVRLIDKSTDIVNRTSLNREGKIHLGLVYGMDRTGATGRRMVRDALRFAPGLQRLLERPIDWPTLRAVPNLYLVASDSMLTPVEVEDHFAALEVFYREQLAADPTGHYLGERPPALFRRVPLPPHVRPAAAVAAFDTVERSVDQLGLKALLRERLLASPAVDVHLRHRVTAIERGGGFAVRCARPDDSEAIFRSDLVVNCLWESRITFDRAMGIDCPVPQNLRLKYGLLVRADAYWRGLRSLTVVHGPYGDVVVNPHLDVVYLSWYPSALRGMMDYGALPPSWDRACGGEVDAELLAELGREHLQAFRRFLPGLRGLDVRGATAGVILGPGRRDIDDRDSLLHTRSESPVRGADGYFSVSTGKYTSAPRNTEILERALEPGGPGAASS